MKRMCLVFVPLVVLLVASTAAMGQEQQTFAGTMPEGAVFYATTQNFESVWKGIEQSNFWAKLTRLKIWEGVDFGWYDDFRDDFADKFGFEFSTDNVMAVFGREFAVALYVTPPEEAAAEAAGAADVENAGNDEEDAEADEGGNVTIELLCSARMNPPDAVDDIVEKLITKAREEGGDDVLIT